MVTRRLRASPRGRRRHPATDGLVVATGPAAVGVAGDHVRVGDGYAATLAVTGYPAEVGLSWLERVIGWPGRVDVAVHIDPLPASSAASGLRRQRARLESARRLDADHGRLDDPLIEAAAEDARDLADRLARGQARLFRVGVYVTVHAPTRADLATAVADVRAAAASVLLDTQPVTWRQLQGWASTLPLGHDGLRLRRTFDTDALAAAFPLASPDLPGPLPGEPAPAGGVLYGVNLDGDGIVWWDRWAVDNYNSVVLARSGAGKSYLVKLDLLRHLYDGVQVAVIDPEDEYTHLAGAVDGTIVRLGAPGVRLNPFDLPAGETRADTLTRRALFLHTLAGVLLGGPPPPTERAALDRAILACYAAAGISNDPATWTRPAPLLPDLAAALHAPEGTADARGREHGPPAEAGRTLAARLAPWTHGSFKDLFDGPTTTRPAGHLVVWSTRHLPDELRPAGMLLALDAIWRDIDTPTPTAPAPLGGRDPAWLANQRTQPAQPDQPRTDSAAGPRRLVVIDEAWTLMREAEGARFLYRLAKAARKRRAGLLVVTQDAADLLGSDLGQAVVANAATQILMRQAPQAITAVTAAFGLTAGEAALLLAAERGDALLLAGGHRVAFHAIAGPGEHDLAATGTDVAGEEAGL